MTMTPANQRTIKLADLNAAHEAFQQIEPRGLFYRVATELINLALQQRTSVTLAEALAVLLQTWNKNAYRFKRRNFDSRHFDDIDGLLRRHEGALGAYRNQKIEELNDSIKQDVISMFEEFEDVLGPVGSAKALHLLAPGVFPLWDIAIAKKNGFPLARSGTNGDRYWRFMLLACDQCRALRLEGATGELLKLIDEYNYCRYTRNVASLVR